MITILKHIRLNVCILILGIILLGGLSGFNDPEKRQWSASNWELANTAKNADYLTLKEKEVIRYLNLARMFPDQFREIELKGYYGPNFHPNLYEGTHYRQSLFSDLENMEPAQALLPKKELYINAKCLAEAQSKSGKTGHKRKSCPKENYAECCSYGVETARDIVLGLLIDYKVPSLGHRMTMLDPTFRYIGPAFDTHKKFRYCCVMEFDVRED